MSSRAWVFFCSLLLAPSLSYGSSITQSFNTVKFWAKRATGQIQPPLVSVIFSPQSPVQGDPVNAFINVQTIPGNSHQVRAYLTATLDGQTISLSNPSAYLWVASLGSFPAVSTHTLHVLTYMEDLNESAETRARIADLNTEIIGLQNQIQNTTNPSQLAALQAQLNQELLQQSIYSQTLLDLRRLMGEDDFNFSVKANTASSNFPHITQVSPNYSIQNGETAVTITGMGFTSQSTVYFGGIQLNNVTFINSTTLRVVIPPQLTAGLKDIEVRRPANTGSGYENAILENAFLVVAGTAPSGLSYALNPGIYTRGIPIQPNTTQLSGGMATSFSITPALPTGISFNALTGAISGTPNVLKPLTAYTITASNSLGSTSAILNLAVNDQIPSSFTYSQSFAAYTKGSPITANIPSATGGTVISYSVSPALPLGLSLDPILGMISGTPTQITPWNEYTVTATNDVGSVSTSLAIVVNDQAPINLSYALNSAVYIKNKQITANLPSNGGGIVTRYSVSPELPSGLSLNPSSGAISGVPSLVSTASQYQVKASNSGGFTTVNLTIAVNDDGALFISDALFDDTLYGTSSNTVSFTVTNTGITSTTLSSISLTPGTPFSITGGTCAVSSVLASGNTCTVTLRFLPPTIGLQKSAIIIAYQNGAITTNASREIFGYGIDTPPTQLSYAERTSTYFQNFAITPNVPMISGGPLVGYSVVPALPSGLTINSTTGVISGTATSVSAAQDYVVIARNTGGFTTTRIRIVVNEAVPNALSYQSTSPIYTRGVMIPANSPIHVGPLPLTYTVSPNLPTGLILDANTGIISGTPTAFDALATYVVTASNAGGSVQIPLSITVNDQAPTHLTYSPGSVNYVKGTTISPNAPTSSGGAVISYSITPALPTGLSLDPQFGVITGTPVVLSPTALYTVTATNTGGSALSSLFIAVVDIAPSSISFSPNPATYTNGLTISPNVPSIGGGAVTSCISSPVLPIGLVLNQVNCALSGTPVGIYAQADYVITATNLGGSISTTLSITVNDVPPSSLVYSLNPAIYTKGTSIATNTLAHAGGVVLSYSISPALPAGLSFDLGTSEISGTPTILSPLTPYTITATNSGGSGTVVLNLAVNDVPPSNLAYSLTPAVYKIETPITNNTPSSSGGPVTHYSIAPSLPSGLSLDASTGVISGTPQSISPLTSYLVTASNSGGNAQFTIQIEVQNHAPYVITPSNMQGWIGSSAQTASTSIVFNPAYPSAGQGSLQMSTGPGTGTVGGIGQGGKAFFSSTLFNHVKLSDLSALSFSMYVPSGIAFTPYVNIYVDLDGTHGVLLVYVPGLVSGSPVLYDTWQTWDALAAQSLFRCTTAVVFGTKTCSTTASSPNIKLADIVAAYPNAQVLDTTGLPSGSNYPFPVGNGGLSFLTGAATGGSYANITGYLSNITIGVGSVIRNYVFGGETTTAPNNLSYLLTTLNYTVGTPIAKNYPSFNGGGSATSFTVTPALPAGIILDPVTGMISGTPTAATPLSNFTISANNAAGSASTVLHLQVQNHAPYFVSPSNMQGWAATNVQTAGTGIVFNPAFPSGGQGSLQLSTGAGTGTVGGVGQGGKAYFTNTAFNHTRLADLSALSFSMYVPSGIAAVTPYINIYVDLDGVHGVLIVYVPGQVAGAPVVYDTWQTWDALGTQSLFRCTTAVVFGSKTCSITASAPNIKLSDIVAAYPNAQILDTTGFPSSSNYPFPVGDGGLSFLTGASTGATWANTTAYLSNITIGVGNTVSTYLFKGETAPAPTNLSYLTTTASYTVGTAIKNYPTFKGGGSATSFTVTPTLPAGITLNSTTGFISGTPTAVTAQGTYQITASNVSGSAQVNLSITVH